MSREIKFRAWSTTAEEMLMPTCYEGETLNEAIAAMSADYELMQYTGLKDKNGAEIYEGDIVKMPHDLHIGDEVVANKDTFVNAIVEWVNGSFRLNKPRDASKNYYGVIYYSENTEPELLEVIGNIYENKDLLAPESKEEE